jgi:hypothetical protein
MCRLATCILRRALMCDVAKIWRARADSSLACGILPNAACPNFLVHLSLIRDSTKFFPAEIGVGASLLTSTCTSAAQWNPMPAKSSRAGCQPLADDGLSKVSRKIFRLAPQNNLGHANRPAHVRTPQVAHMSRWHLSLSEACPCVRGVGGLCSPAGDRLRATSDRRT